MAGEEDFAVTITADVSGLTSALDDAASQTKSVADSMQASLASSGQGMAQAASTIESESARASDAIGTVREQAESLSNQTVTVHVEADTSEATSALDGVSAHVGDSMKGAGEKVEAETHTIKESFKEINEAAEGMFSKLKNAFGGGGGGGLLSILGFAGVGEAIEGMAHKLEDMGHSLEITKQALGVSANEAKAWQVAASRCEVDASAFTMAVRRLGTEVAAGGPVLQKLGIDIKDSGGHAKNMSDILKEVITRLGELDHSADTAAIGQKLLGRQSIELQAKSEELIATQEKLSKSFESQGADYEKVISQAHTLHLVEGQIMAQWNQIVSAAGPQLTMELRDISIAVMALAAAFQSAITVVNGFIQVATDAIVGVGEAMDKFNHGDFSGAVAAAGGAFDKIKLHGGQAADDVVKTWKGATDKMRGMWQLAAGTPHDTWSGMQAGGEAGGEGEDAGKEHLDAKEILHPDKGGGGGRKKGGGGGGSDPSIAMNSQLEKVEDKWQELKDVQQKLTQDMATDSGKKFQELAGTAQADFQKMEQAHQQLTDALNANDKDAAKKFTTEWSLAFEKFKKDSAAAQQQFNKDQKQMDAETKKVAQGIASEFSSIGQALVGGTQSIAQIWQGLLQKMLGELIQYVSQMVVYWAVSQFRMQSDSETANNGIIGSLVKMLSSSVAARETSTLEMEAADEQQIISNTATGAVGAASSQASIPYVGPVLAAAAAASFVAEMSAYHAAQGFDVPAGMSPLTQLHPREMVLPANLAEGVRDMTRQSGGRGQGGSGGGNSTHNYNINALDGKSVQDILAKNGGFISDLVKAQVRSGRHKIA